MSSSSKVNSKMSKLRLTESAAMQPVALQKPEKKTRELPEQWMYGLRLKLRDCHRICKKWGLPWEEDPIACKHAITDWVIRATGVYFAYRSVTYRGEIAQIVTFVIDKERRLESNEFSETQMENVRKLFGIKHKPRWFELYDRNKPSDDEDALSSGDEEFPYVELDCRVDDDKDEELEMVNESDLESESESDKSD